MTRSGSMRRPEISALTGVRFYAALLVFLSHVSIVAPGMDTLSGQRLLFNAGVVGVSFFFVLSGFILTYNYADAFRIGVGVDGYKRFVWDRFSKIYPVHFAALILVLPIALRSPNLPLDWRAVPFHLLLLQCFWPFFAARLGSYLNVPSWSISCEWLFYLLAPIAIYLVSRRAGRRLVVTLAAVYSILAFVITRGQSDYNQLTFVSWFAPTRFLEFLVGVFLGHAFLAASAPKLENGRALAQVTGIVLIVAGAILRGHAAWPFWGGLLYVPGSALLVFSLACGGTVLTSHLGQSVVKKLGVASFSFYLIHAPILRAARGVCLHFGWQVHSWVGFWGVAAAMFLLAEGAALALCHTYEIPVQRYLRGFLRSSNAHRPDVVGLVTVP